MNMIINDIHKDLYKYKPILEQYGVKLPANFEFKNYSWRNTSEIELCRIYTNLNVIDVRIIQRKDEEKFKIICDVTDRRGFYENFKQLGSTKIYTEYKFEYILQWFKYVKQITHLICQTEDYVQKTVSNNIRKGIIFKDDLI